MRRIILTLMILFLPVQGTWAAVTVYCNHETGNGESRHFGHHFHRHQASANGSSTDSSQTGGIDNDCGFCHLNFKLVHAMSFDGPSNCELSLVNAPCSTRYSSYIPEEPDRPKWQVLARPGETLSHTDS